MGDVDNEGDYARVGSGAYEKFLHLPINFAMNPKLFWKKQFLKKNRYVSMYWHNKSST